MSFDTEKLLDDVGWKLLGLLQENARLSYSELGKQVGLSAPGVADRVRRMEDAGIITGYRAEVNAEKVDLPITAFMQIRPTGNTCMHMVEVVSPLSEVHECHHVAGGNCYILKVIVSSIAHLEDLIERLTPYGDLTTSIVLSSPIIRKAIEPQTHT